MEGINIFHLFVRHSTPTDTISGDQEPISKLIDGLNELDITLP